MKQERRYARFEPVTVRAAARVVRLARAGRLSRWEAAYYVQQLAGMDRMAHASAGAALRRLARRRASLGQTGVFSALRRRQLPRRDRAVVPLAA